MIDLLGDIQVSTYIGHSVRSTTYMSVDAEVYSQVYSNFNQRYHRVYINQKVDVSVPIANVTRAHMGHAA